MGAAPTHYTSEQPMGWCRAAKIVGQCRQRTRSLQDRASIAWYKERLCGSRLDVTAVNFGLTITTCRRPRTYAFGRIGHGKYGYHSSNRRRA